MRVTRAALLACLMLAGCGAVVGPSASTGRAAFVASSSAAGGGGTRSTTPAHAASIPAARPVRVTARGPAQAPDPAAWPIPIVVYHVIAAPPATRYHYLYVSPARFARQMAALRAAGYCAITLDVATAIWTGRQTPPPGCLPLVLRFDDGYASVFTAAFPVLAQMHWTGNLCQQVQRIDFPGGLSARDIETLVAAGWELADHGYRQPEMDLVGATAGALRLQVVTSRQDLQQRFGVADPFYCWPLGYYDAAAIAAVRAAGFTGALGVTVGDAEPASQGWWRLDAIPAWGPLTTRALVADVERWQKRAPGQPPARYGPHGAPQHAATAPKRPPTA